jgi:O-succinylbenzoic acid--CoA ligase
MRRLVPLPLPGGPRVLNVLPALAKALAGQGDALLPVPAGDDAEASRRIDAALVEEPLRPGEDDDADPTAFVVSTSGSTGTPKGALLPVSALQASATATAERIGGPGRWLLALPSHHVAGLQVLLRSIAAGTEPGVLDLSAGFDGAAFAAATAALGGGRRYTSVVPTQLARLLDRPDALLEYDAVLVGGAGTPPALLERARAAGVKVVTTYGMSETCGGCVYDGEPLRDVRVRLDQDGRVHLGGPVVARGYRGLPELTAEVFAGAEFRTDDLGELVDGRLRLLGRADDVIVTGGLKVAPAAVEDVLTRLPAVREAVVVGVPDDEWGSVVTAVVVATDATAPPVLDDLRAAFADRAVAPRRLVVVDALPLRGPGKPDRVAAARLAAQQ